MVNEITKEEESFGESLKNRVTEYRCSCTNIMPSKVHLLDASLKDSVGIL